MAAVGFAGRFHLPESVETFSVALHAAFFKAAVPQPRVRRRVKSNPSRFNLFQSHGRTKPNDPPGEFRAFAAGEVTPKGDLGRISNRVQNASSSTDNEDEANFRFESVTHCVQRDGPGLVAHDPVDCHTTPGLKCLD
jgi:hypothetical protein